MNTLARVIAFYLPQFHPIPENDEWWGKGFTEWTNVAKAKPLFRGHYQPHIPADLGFYDLRVPETRIAQAEMAREYGIKAFCYYHYWFAGKRLLERPFTEVLETGEPDFPFCLCWANQTWTGVWHGCEDRILIEQTYPGRDDYEAHFHVLLRAFSDKRYVTVDGKPILLVLKPNEIPNVKSLTDLWRELSLKRGLKGLFLVGCSPNSSWVPQEHGFDAAIRQGILGGIRPWVSKREPLKWLIRQYQIKTGKPTVYFYKNVLYKLIQDNIFNAVDYPCLIPNWDNTPRCGLNGLVLHDSTPESFRIYVKKGLEAIRNLPADQKIIFVKSWNEWAEGNHLEPDLKYGMSYLQVVKQEIFKSSAGRV